MYEFSIGEKVRVKRRDNTMPCYWGAIGVVISIRKATPRFSKEQIFFTLKLIDGLLLNSFAKGETEVLGYNITRFIK